MGVMTTTPSRPFTRADLAAMPDDGHRYELIDGVLVVTPAPSLNHQSILVALIIALNHVKPTALRLLAAPFDVALAGDTVVQPDLLLAPKSDFSAKDLPVAPTLAIEILSPSTRRFDLILKRARYEAAGCEHYWVVDPDEPRITAWTLRDGVYVEVADAAGDDEFVVTEPVELTLHPSSLLD